jgi:RES domain-containing protein
VVLVLPVRRITWSAATRIIASRFPPVHLYERVSSDPAIWEALIAAEVLVSPRVRDEVGEIHLVPVEERVSGPGATWVMAPFVDRNPKGSRFSDGSYGVYYAASDLPTAIAETAYHFARFAADSDDGVRYEDMRVLVGRIDTEFHDLESVPEADLRPLLDPNSYAASQAFATALRVSQTNGIHYPSVRRPDGRCVAAFRPKAVGMPKQTKHLQYHWDGSGVRRYYDYETETWTQIG